MISTQQALLTELEPVVEANLNRHLEMAKPWNPHDYVPWSRGRDFAFLGGEDWSPEDSSRAASIPWNSSMAAWCTRPPDTTRATSHR
jgi:hypothetical protein